MGVDLSQKRSEIERSNANWDGSRWIWDRSKRVWTLFSDANLYRTEMDLDKSEIDLNEYKHFFEADLNRSEIEPSIGSIF